MNTSSVSELLEDLRAGKMIILVDDEDRENEGDLVCAAEFASPEIINFMAKYARGLICLSLDSEILDQLKIPMMVKHNSSKFGTAFSVSIEAREGVTTGISAADRARTIQVAVDPHSTPADIVMPGHIFPLRAESGGVLKRAGQTEGSVDLARLAGLRPAGVICEIMKEDGEMARREDLEKFAFTHGLKIGTVAELIRYRMYNESLIKNEGSAKIPSKFGKDFSLHVFSNTVDQAQHVAFVKGAIHPDEPALVRVHSECLTGDVFGSQRCDCGEQLQAAVHQIDAAGKGVLVYMRQEGRGIGLLNKILAYQLQDGGLDTVEANHKLGFKADLRDYGIGAQILRSLGVRKMKLLTNNPKKIVGLDGYGLEVIERIGIEMPSTDQNRNYLKTKRDRMGHILSLVDGISK
jgi:3,4-dihydroxy 2-butanone 4-phosphate synthase/GTP cyclohydrolase II